ncbi:MAG TPA: hypothetical protein VN665_00280 [Candidatus Paceibacterota bacterium]|nr:hypothetical protein [Candidatus Paceibacterota bacterium]
MITAAVLASPLYAFAISPIGGKVTSMVPCPHNAGYIVTVVGFGIGSGVFWYVPGLSFAYLYGPPFVGEWILGMSDVPTGCGERITYSGTSPILKF